MRILSLSFALAAAFVAGCSSARVSDQKGDELFRAQNYEAAAEHFKKGLEKQGDEGRDRLLYLLDLGLALHGAGKLEESTKVFLEANELAEIKDYTSLSREAATLLVSDNTKDYKGEDFEKVLINTYLAINFALMGNIESALVEARQVNRKLGLMVSEGERKYKQNAFARYLSAVLYEADGNYNSALVDYKFTQGLMPAYPGLGGDLYRAAWKMGMQDEMERWKKAYELTKEQIAEAKQAADRKKGEIIVIYQNGISPAKRPNPNFRTLPKFVPRPNPVARASVWLGEAKQGETAELHNIEETAIQNLDEKYGGLVAKKIGGVVAKEVVGAQIERMTDSPLAGALAKLALYASDQADLRSWNLLPRDLQVLRITVEPGTHTVRVLPEGAAELPSKTVSVSAGKKTFVSFRYMP